MASIARSLSVSLALLVALLLALLLVATLLSDSPCSPRGLASLHFSRLLPSLVSSVPILQPLANSRRPSLLPALSPSASSNCALLSARATPEIRAAPLLHGGGYVGDPSAILPEYLGHVAAGGEGLAWRGGCFEQVTARLALGQAAGRTRLALGRRTGGEDAAGTRRIAREARGRMEGGAGREGRAERRKRKRGKGGGEWVMRIQEDAEREGGTEADGRTGGEVACGEENAATVTFTPCNKQRLLCADVYLLATPFHLAVRLLPLARPNRVEWPAMGPLEADYVQQRGIAAFRLPRGLWGGVKALLQLLPLASDSQWGEAAQMRFLQQHMNASFTPHVPLAPVPDLTLPAFTSFLASGDLLLTNRFRGPWGLFETLEKWATGSYAAHAALLLRAEGGEGELWVAESGRISVTGRPEIALESFADWWRRQERDRSGQHVAVVPLGAEARRRWDNGKAWRFVESMVGRQFGYHNIIFSWIDTAGSNFPPPVNENTVAALVAVWSRVQPDYAASIWNEALNRRLATQSLSFEQVLVECQRRNISFGQLLAVPEQDSWRYSDGLSLSCVAFALRTWKEAGVFGELTADINTSEFTIRDAYQLHLFASNASHLPPWCFTQQQSGQQSGESERQPDGEAQREGEVRGGGEALVGHGREQEEGERACCQLLGKWRFDLPGFNSIPLYAHMNERCPTLPPQYTRPSSC